MAAIFFRWSSVKLICEHEPPPPLYLAGHIHIHNIEYARNHVLFHVRNPGSSLGAKTKRKLNPFAEREMIQMLADSPTSTIAGARAFGPHRPSARTRRGARAVRQALGDLWSSRRLQ